MEWLKQISPSLNIVGGDSWNKGFIEPDRIIYDHELVLFTSGECVLTIGEEQYNCIAPYWVIVPPGETHRTTVSNEDEAYRYWVHFDWIYIKESAPLPICTYAPEKANRKLLKFAPNFVPPGILHGRINYIPDALKMIERLINAYQSDIALNRMSARGIALELLTKLIGFNQFAISCKSNKRGEALASMLKAHLEKIPPQTIGIRCYIEELGYSYGHLCKLFKTHYGLSPLTYLNLLRLEIATLTLRNPRANIAVAAEAAGFNSPAYFSRIFRKHFGIPPREWQRCQII